MKNGRTRRPAGRLAAVPRAVSLARTLGSGACGPSPPSKAEGPPSLRRLLSACLPVPCWKLVGPHLTRKLSFNIRSLFCLICCRQVTQSCPTLCDPVDCSPPGSSVHGILQAGILEWVAISSSRRPRDQTRVSCTAGGFFTAESLF